MIKDVQSIPLLVKMVKLYNMEINRNISSSYSFMLGSFVHEAIITKDESKKIEAMITSTDGELVLLGWTILDDYKEKYYVHIDNKYPKIKIIRYKNS